MVELNEDAVETPVEESVDTPVEETSTPSEVDPFDVETNDTFDRKYVEKLRKEAASNRDRARTAEERSKILGEDQDTIDAWGDLIHTFNTDPKAAAQRFQEISQRILDGESVQEATANVDEADEDQPLTRSQYEQLRAQEAAQAQISEDVKGIERHAGELGYDVASDDYLTLLVLADKNYGGDIDKAHAALESRKQKVIDDYIAAKQKDAENGTAPVAGGAPGSERDIKTMADADNAARSRIGSFRRGSK